MLRAGSHKAGTWALPSGHIDVGETGAQTCIREVMEELGIKIDKVEKYGFIDNILEDEGLHYVTLYYKATKWDESQEIIIQERNKIAQVAWVDPNNPPEPVFTDNARKMIKKYGKKQKKSPEDIMNGFVKEMIAKDKKRKGYFKSGAVDKDIEIIKEFFENREDKCIDDEGVKKTKQPEEEMVNPFMRSLPYS
jgi:ADP-ribose pyrophosphatase YjhB (NUDIX family)